MPIEHSDTEIALLMFLLVCFIVKHFLADFVIVSKFMLRKTDPENWFLPLLSHAGVHAFFTTLITAPLVGWWCSLLFGLADMSIHFFVDYWKAQRMALDIKHERFWVVLGMDQTLHHLTYLPIAYMAIHFAHST